VTALYLVDGVSANAIARREAQPGASGAPTF